MDELKGHPIRTVDDLEPLISFYAGILGEKPGRLIAALSLLTDLEFTNDWQAVAPEVRLSISLARTLTADVFRRLMAEQGSDGREAEEIAALFGRWTNRHDGA